MLETRFIQGFDGQLKGQTQPYLVSLAQGEQAVIKLICQQGCVCFKEYLAICMAEALELRTFCPIQVCWPVELLEVIPQSEWLYTQLQRHKLAAFGTLYKPGGTLLRPQDTSRSILLEQMVTIFCFDLLIRNFDRQPGNSNLMHFAEQPEQIYVLDHEMGFGYEEITSPWVLNAEEKIKIQAHILYPELKRSLNTDYAKTAQWVYSCIEKMQSNFEGNFWQSVKSNTPESWFQDVDYVKIKTTLDVILSHQDEFIEQILEVLR